MKYINVFSLLYVLALLGCPPSPIAPQPDADAVAPPAPAPQMDSAPPPLPASPTATQVCSALKRAGCATGQATNCGPTIDAILAHPGIKALNVACIEKATTPAAVQACGADCN